MRTVWEWGNPRRREKPWERGCAVSAGEASFRSPFMTFWPLADRLLGGGEVERGKRWEGRKREDTIFCASSSFPSFPAHPHSPVITSLTLQGASAEDSCWYVNKAPREPLNLSSKQETLKQRVQRTLKEADNTRYNCYKQCEKKNTLI